jgi:hypothetical protein
VPWTESSSAHFEARHEDTDAIGTVAVLELLEATRESLARTFPRIPDEVAAQYTVTDPRIVDALSPFYVWTTDYAEKRLEWKRRHPLHVLLLRTYRIPRPVTVKVKDEYAGCRSWLELSRELPFEGTPVLSDEEFERAAEEIESIALGARQPVFA